MKALTVARRELAGHFHAPIAWVVGTLFLAAQGFSFWAVIQTLADPEHAPTYGAVLRQHFGGTLLHWAIVLPVVAAISMRLVAEDKRQGTWELLGTAPVAEETVLLGKWLGAVAFYALLWLPTLLHLLVLRAVAGAGVDPGPVIAAYGGALLVGAGFLAVGIAASAATANQIVAAVVTFALLLGLLLVGQIPELAPGWIADAPRAAAVLHALDVRDHMDRFARGAVDTPPILFHLGVAAVGLAAASVTAVAGRRRAGELRARALAALLVLVIAV
ncbi:MAG TPA: ABC transporter permease, partial [Kofleriaceae bacterium]|nr:ABC transporter permease [Kofleriaceae bacterium]